MVMMMETYRLHETTGLGGLAGPYMGPLQDQSVSTVSFDALGLPLTEENASTTTSDVLGPTAYTVPAGFPTSVFPSYYIPPAPTQEPQPALYDPVLNITYPLNLTNPDTIPTDDNDAVFYPQPTRNVTNETATALVQSAIANISAIIDADDGTSNCTKCQSALAIAKQVAQVTPTSVPGMLVTLCDKYQYQSNASCQQSFGASTYGSFWTQILAFADPGGLDSQYICNTLSDDSCSQPAVSPLDTTDLFPKPKPENATAPPPSGVRAKVLHLSDFHIDPRYVVGAEANCTGGLCCRPGVHAAGLSLPQIELPAPLYGAYLCDTPYFLGLAALQSIGPLTGTSTADPLAFAIYTGDLVSHDGPYQLSRAYTEYAEDSVFSMFKQYITGPVYAVLGNHDSNPQDADAPHSEPDGLGQQLSWNYNHVAGLWEQNDWLNSSAVDNARLNYGAYSAKTGLGLRIITLNTDFWYNANRLNYYNMTNPDVSGMQAFLIEELQAAEDAGERVWILGHVPSGYDGVNTLPNPSNLFYQIVDRYSPHVIANVFFGHTHRDEFMIYYANNASSQTAADALTTGWIGPSITPLTSLNSGFRMYEVDTATFDVYEAYTWYADVSAFSSIDPAVSGPTYELEYSSRDTYNVFGWSSDAPLNATFWHLVTEAMEQNGSLVERYSALEPKLSGADGACTSTTCQQAKICYMRSGSAALGKACPQG
ncbi:MAG: hypothetical protein Q9214_001042 [Letrouitia sp. 1 TL-2023]